MTDSILTGILTLGLLIGGSAAIVSEAARPGEQPATVAATIVLPAVMVTGHRHTAEAVVVASAR